MKETCWILITIISWGPVWFMGRIYGWKEGWQDSEGTRGKNEVQK